MPKVNNEIVFTPQYKNRMTQLKFLVAVKYLKDTVVVPKESEHFGYFADASETTFIKMEDTQGNFTQIFEIFKNSVSASLRIPFL